MIIEISEELQNYTAFVNNLVSSGTVVSLKSLYREIYENIIRLRIYCRFTEHFEELSGDTFLIELNIFKSHGDLTIRKIATNLFNSMISLYYEYLMNWLTKGLPELLMENSSLLKTLIQMVQTMILFTTFL